MHRSLGYRMKLECFNFGLIIDMETLYTNLFSVPCMDADVAFIFIFIFIFSQSIIS